MLRGREDILAIYCLLFEIYLSPILSTFFSKSHQHYSDDDDSVYEFTYRKAYAVFYVLTVGGVGCGNSATYLVNLW